ncbi:MAG: DsbA family protein, partial [Candidatus Aenigmarchaeota archaeon]|nr:DsbA family protein [Candidatus Aenigmarchaeota archaeon]
QNKFWEMYDKIFSEQQEIDSGTVSVSLDDLKNWSQEIGLNQTKFDYCLDTGYFAGKVQRDIDQGNYLGVAGVPTFFINGGLLVGAQPLASFEERIDRILSGVGHDQTVSSLQTRVSVLEEIVAAIQAGLCAFRDFSFCSVPDTVPPMITVEQPSFSASITDSFFILKVTTDEAATCQSSLSRCQDYPFQGVGSCTPAPYAPFAVTGNTTHATAIANLTNAISNETVYEYYVLGMLCQDSNANTQYSFYTFTVDIQPSVCQGPFAACASSTECCSGLTCRPTGQSCQTLSCTQFTAQDQCIAHNGCSWRGGFVSRGCSGQYQQCEQQSSCQL